jgi:putative Holliday junction resolvase
VNRVAAVDFGTRRIGLAVSDPLGITARGLPTVERRGTTEEAVRAVAAALAAERVERVVVGVPVLSGGREGATAEGARAFGALLAAALGVPVEYFDETLTTWEAEEDLREGGVRLDEARRSGAVDRQAARRLLLSWLRR